MTTAAPTRATITVPDRDTTHLYNYGATLSASDAGQPDLREVVLPEGWTVTSYGFVLDQHERLRLTVTSYAGGPEVFFYTPASHARAVAEHGDTLVLDEWATPGSMLGTVGERIDTFQRLIYVNERGIARWEGEQPETAARYRTELASYRAKLAAYTGLLQQITEAVTSGWTPSWTDLDTEGTATA